MSIVVSLQVRCGNRVSYRTFHTFFNHCCLVFTPCQQIYFLSAKNSRYSHCNRTDRSIFYRSENLGCFVTWCIIQQNQTSGRVQTRTRFVECDITYTTNPQQRNINAPETFDTLLIQTAVLKDCIFGDGTVRCEDILFVNIDMIQQHFLQSVEVAVDSIRRQRIVFIHIKYDHVAEAESFFLVHTDQLRIYMTGWVSSG